MNCASRSNSYEQLSMAYCGLYLSYPFLKITKNYLENANHELA